MAPGFASLTFFVAVGHVVHFAVWVQTFKVAVEGLFPCCFVVCDGEPFLETAIFSGFR